MHSTSENLIIKYKWGDLKTEIGNSTKIAGNFDTPLSIMARSSRQKINKMTAGWNYAIDQTDLSDLYRTLHPTTTECRFFSSSRGILSRRDQTLGYTASLNTFKNDSQYLFQASGVKLEITNRRKTGKLTSRWK